MKTIKLVAILCCFAFGSCGSTKALLYDKYSHEQTTKIKAASEKTIDNAVNPYASHEAEVQQLLLDCNAMLTYEKGKPNNEIVISMWQLMTNDEKNLLGGFLKRWKDKGSLSPFFIVESKKQIVEAFDLLLEYELKKDKKSETNLLNLINQ